jgi:hypothetical protein
VSLLNNDPAHPVHILSLECSDPRIEIATEAVRVGINYRVAVTLKTGEEVGKGGSGTIVLQTDHPSQPRLVLPYLVALGHPRINRQARDGGP